MAGDRHAMSPGGPGATLMVPESRSTVTRTSTRLVHRSVGPRRSGARRGGKSPGMSPSPTCLVRAPARRRRARTVAAWAAAGALLCSAPISSTGAVAAAGRPADEAWLLPSAGPVAALFLAPDSPWGPGHRGIDLVAGDGAPVTAPRAGVVAFAATVVDRGVLTLEHPGGLRTSLEPVAPSVGVGDVVRAGELLGTVGAGAGHCVGCLHWGVRSGSRYLDPLGLLARTPVVLLPALSPARPPGGRCADGAWPPCASGRSATR